MRGFSWKIIYHFEITLGTSIFTFLCEIDTLVRWNSLTFWLFCVKLWKQVHFFFWNCERLIFKILGLDTRFYGLFYVKNEVSAVNLIYFIFYCGTVSRENWVKLVIFFCFIWLKKWNWLMVSWVKTGIKFWNRPEVGREKKWNWRHAATPRPSVSFFSRPTLDGFTILASFTHETTASFIFEPKKQKKKIPVSPSFTWNWPQKK